MQVEDQKKWERDMIDFGVARFRSRDAAAVERGNYSEAHGGGRLLRAYLPQVSEHLSATLIDPPRARANKFVVLARMVDCDKLAMFALTVMVEAIYKEQTVASITRRIGQFVEDEIRFSKFALENPEYFQALQRDLDKRNSSSVRHRRGVLNAKMIDKGVTWQSWEQATAIGVGMQIFLRVMDSVDWLQSETSLVGGKKRTKVTATDEVKAWIESSADATALLLPDRMPCLIPPLDWTTPDEGGYHTKRLRYTTPMVKVRWQPTKDRHRALLRDADMPQVYSAVNALQRVEWRVNEAVLNTMQTIYEKNLGTAMPNSTPYTVSKCPDLPKEMNDDQKAVFEEWKSEAREIYALEKKRRTQVLEVTRTMRIGEMLKEKPSLYFVYQCDFRGRLYCATSGLSPQGADPSRACLEFAQGQTLTEDGLYWLCVHGANKYGYDKASYDDRVKWIEHSHDEWVAAGTDPVANRSIWAAADKPWQFLAWCVDYARVAAGGQSHTAVALDGSCNGLQHFSAMLRDPVGGSAVNLMPAALPADIYQQVADVATKKLRTLSESNNDEGVAAQNWLALFKSIGDEGMGRKLAKKPVMTLPYGSTLQACTSSVFEWLIDSAPTFLPEGTRFKHSVFLSKILWDSISEVVVSARHAMKWVQDCSKVLSKENTPILYTTPLGLPVFQSSMKSVTKRIKGVVGGRRMRVTINEYLDTIDGNKQRQGCSPNLVHSVDATHLMMCVNAGVEYGIKSFAMIHDDFGVLPNEVTAWHRIIREQFVKLHTETDVLAAYGSDIDVEDEDLPELPNKGTLDLANVLKSKYFFG